MSYYKETAFGTACNNANVTLKFETNDPITPDMTQERRDDAALIKGHEFPVDPTADVVVSQDVSIPFSFPCSLEVAGLLYALAMGNYNAAGNNNAYTHTNKALDPCSNDTLPSTT
jgi:hypothetical protein